MKKTGYIPKDVIGSDNVLLVNPDVGPYLMKSADFNARKTGVLISIYPVIEDTKTTGLVPVYSAVLPEHDYKNIIPIEAISVHLHSANQPPAS